MRVALVPLVLLASCTLVQAQNASPGGGHYTITQGGKTVGEAEYSAAPIPGGRSLTSSGKLNIDKFSYSFRSVVTVDAQDNLVRDELSGSVHSAKVSANNVQFNTASDSTGRELQLSIDADGKKSTNTVDRHRNTVIAPDLDPAAYSLMAHLALQHPKTAWVLIPKETGILVPAEYTTVADVRGTYNGQSVTVKHSIVALSDQNSVVIEIFYTPDGQVMETDLNAQGLFVTRDGFKLINRPKPVAPPHGQAPPAQDPNQPQQQQPGQQQPQ